MVTLPSLNIFITSSRTFKLRDQYLYKGKVKLRLKKEVTASPAFLCTCTLTKIFEF